MYAYLSKLMTFNKRKSISVAYTFGVNTIRDFQLANDPPVALLKKNCPTRRFFKLPSPIIFTLEQYGN